MELVVHNIAATIAMWYFHKGDADYAYPASPSMTTLKWGFGSGFGSLCMVTHLATQNHGASIWPRPGARWLTVVLGGLAQASFILTVVRIIVMMIEQVGDHPPTSILVCFLLFCFVLFCFVLFCDDLLGGVDRAG
jgi:hypothetical protein